MENKFFKELGEIDRRVNNSTIKLWCSLVLIMGLSFVCPFPTLTSLKEEQWNK